MFDFEGVKIKWLGHAGFKIKKKKVVYIDPYHIDETEEADLILITHEHYDHCSPDDIKKIIKEDTVTIGPKSAIMKLEHGNTFIIKPGDRKEFDDIIIDVIPAYNIGKKFHPKEKGGVGYIITIDGKKIYHAGDTDLIPEMEKLVVDVALLPVGGEYTMNAEEAASAANKIKPKIAVPMHYGSIIGSKEDAEEFSKLCECEVRILGKGEN
ncbi:MBL fold metallo-hydrolase [Candidatus Woesearchaeota archaeon]|nr:MBL fold metallo-hydrolase [Candidatus Woesearchaeota archaeon]